MKSKSSGIASALFLVAILAVAGALVVFGLVRAPRTPIYPGENVETEDAAEVKADRPANVGNELGEAFLRKVSPPATIPPSGLIRVTDETFSAAYDELYDHRDQYYGREIELSGYVLSQEGLEPGLFLVGRDLLWCCELDKYFIGFLAAVDPAKIPVPQPDSTIIVRGVLAPMEYHNPENGENFTVPAIRVTRLAPIENIPKQIYPN